MSRHHLYLISDSTGETVQTIGRACTVQFEQVEVVEHLWPMVRSPRALEIVIEELEEEPGLVLYTLLDRALAETLEDYCKRRSLTCISVIDPFIEMMAAYFGEKSRDMPGRQHELDDEYFQRIDAINYVMQHDDGQHTGNLEEADVVLVGVSRTSKTPTSIYLANRGVKAANVPIVPDQPLPEILFGLTRPLVVGLTEDPRRLVDLRRSRMRQSLGDTETAYTDIDAVRKEVADARRLFGRYGWPVIDVTRRSIEETAAAILRLVRDRARRLEEGADADLLSLGRPGSGTPGRAPGGGGA